MKRLYSILLALWAAAAMLAACAQKPDTYFPYPEISDENASLTERCNLLVYKFWDRCNIKQSFSSLERLNGAFGDWLSFMPYATVDTIHLAIDNYLNAVAKTGTDNLLAVGRMAESWIYSDSAQYQSEQLFLPFAKYMAENKKVGKKEKEHYAAIAKVIESSGLGATIPAFDITLPDGSKKSFGNELASRVVLMILEPGNFDSTFARTRLAADFNVGKLVDQSLVKIVAIVPTAPSQEGKDLLAGCPESWTTGFLPGAAEYFDLSAMPAIFYLDSRHKVLGKELTADQLMAGLRAINQQMQQQ